MLAEKLAHFVRFPLGLVLGLPRGGVPVAHAVAQRLKLPLDVFMVRKLGIPGNEEVAMGAIASGGISVMNEEIVAGLGISERTIAGVQAREQRTLERREHLYRSGRPTLRCKGLLVIVVDDGIATGATMNAAVRALRSQGALRIVVATPVMAASTYLELARLADDVVTVIRPEKFQSVGQWYADFAQTTDDEVIAMLADSIPPGPE